MTEEILQIIPTKPNWSDGVGDYALLLATQLLKDAQIKTRFLVFRNDIEVDPFVNGFSIARFPSHQPDALCSSIPEGIGTIIVHFGSYPYFQDNLKGNFGVDTPFWLIEALQSVVKSRHLKLIVMFHELPKFYWSRMQLHLFGFLNPIHSIVSRRLARMADAVFTNTTGSQVILSKWQRKSVTKLLVFSNMGETESSPPSIVRKRRLVIFGGAGRSRIYKNNFQALIQSCKSLGIEEICDVGPSLKLTEHLSSEIKLVEMGWCSQTEISELMLTSLAGCIDYSLYPGELGKSGIFAAYCAHGLVPILTNYNPSEADGLYMNQHYLALDSKLSNLDSGLAELQMIAEKAYEWYQTHTLKKIAKTFSSCIESIAS
jgi:hypothetical protein